MNKPNITNVKSNADKCMHIVFVLAAEIALTALAIQGALSLIHTQKNLQVSLSVGLIFALLVIKYRSK